MAGGQNAREALSLTVLWRITTHTFMTQILLSQQQKPQTVTSVTPVVTPYRPLPMLPSARVRCLVVVAPLCWTYAVTRHMNTLRRILPLGHPNLKLPSMAVVDVTSAEAVAARTQLIWALDEFRQKHGFGRAMAAPQLGYRLRLIALNLGKGSFVMYNPVLSSLSRKTFLMYDDCMCFPDLLVRVRRHTSLTVSYLDEAGARQTWANVTQEVAELLQHEVDHLDGLLSFDRMEGSNAIISRAAYASNKVALDALVDYVIQPTV